MRVVDIEYEEGSRRTSVRPLIRQPAADPFSHKASRGSYQIRTRFSGGTYIASPGLMLKAS
jgi:hypothetical protein